MFLCGKSKKILRNSGKVDINRVAGNLISKMASLNPNQHSYVFKTLRYLDEDTSCRNEHKSRRRKRSCFVCLFLCFLLGFVFVFCIFPG